MQNFYPKQECIWPAQVINRPLKDFRCYILRQFEPHTFSILEQLVQMPELQGFSLVNGTALSLLYGHRISLDLDNRKLSLTFQMLKKAKTQ